METVTIESDSIQLDQFLKWVGIAQTGGHAKMLIAEGLIEVNGETEHKRSKKLVPGDQVYIKDGGTFKIVKE